MADYGQFCPVAKASEVLGERWALLILRELILGTSRFSDFQRGLSRISPSVLTKRLDELEQAGIIIKKSRHGHRGFEYYLTAAGKELAPLIENLAVWGMRWARGQLSDDELDVEFLMREIQRRINTESLPEGETVICFIFEELSKYKCWWVVVNGDEVDLCTENPGKDVDLYVMTQLRPMVEIWTGALDLALARKKKLVKISGNRQISSSMVNWLGINPYASIEQGPLELMRIAADSN